LEIILDKKNSTEGIIKITLKPEDYQSKWSEKLKEYGKKASLKGFRPGKVPPALIKKIYGTSILVEEINHILSHTLQDYIKEQDFKILGDPLPVEDDSDINFEQPGEFVFSYEVGWAEDFAVDFEKLGKVVKYEIEVEDEDLNTTIENIREQNGESIHGETVAENDDVDLEITLPSGDVKKKHIHLKNIEKALKKQIVGKKEGDIIKFDPIKLLGVESATKWLGTDEEISLPLEAKINHFHGKASAELNQEFFDKIIGPGKASNEEEFKAEVKRIMGENYNQETEGLLLNDIREKMVEGIQFEIPSQFLIKWFTKRNNQSNDAEAEAEFTKNEKGIRWELIMEKISRDNDIKVEHEEIIAKTKEMIMGQFGNIPQTPEMEASLNNWADNYLKQQKGENYSQMFERVRFDKVMNFVRDKVQIEPKKVSWKEFQTEIAG
jgi:trigger factor